MPSKNSTFDTEPFASAAFAVIMIAGPLVNCDPFAGDVIDTVGGVLTAAAETVTVTAVEVVGLF